MYELTKNHEYMHRGRNLESVEIDRNHEHERRIENLRNRANEHWDQTNNRIT